MKDVFGEPINCKLHLKNGFWPQSRVFVSMVDQYKDNGMLREEFTQNAP